MQIAVTPDITREEYQALHRLLSELIEKGAVLKSSYLTPLETATILSILSKIDAVNSG